MWWILVSPIVSLLRDSHSKWDELLCKSTSSSSRDNISKISLPSSRAFDVAGVGGETVGPEEPPFNRDAVLGASLVAFQLYGISNCIFPVVSVFLCDATCEEILLV